MRELCIRIAVAISGEMLLVKQKLNEGIENFRRDERGLSGVVVAVLLILVAVLAVVLIWELLGDYIVDTWERLVGQDDPLQKKVHK